MLGDRIDRPERRRRAPSVLERGEHPAVDRIDRPARALRRRGRPSDRLPPGRLPVPAVVAGERRDVPAQRRAAARPRRRRAVARRARGGARWRPGSSADGVARARRSASATASPIRTASRWDSRRRRRRRGVTIERDTEVTGIRRRRRPGRRASRRRAGRSRRAVVVNAAGPYARLIGRMAGADVPVDPYPPAHLHRRAGRRRLHVPVVAHHGHRLRDDVLLSSRGRRAAVRHGRSGTRRRPSTRRCSGISCRR